MPKFAVAVEDAKYVVEAPDEQTAWNWATWTHQNQPQKVEAAPFSLTDVGLTGASAATGAARSLLQAFGPQTPGVETLGEFQKTLEGMKTPERQAEIQRRRTMEELAAKTGTATEEVGAFLGGIKEAPVQAIAQGVGSTVPALLAGAATLVAGAPAAIATAVAIGSRFLFGALQGAGEVKGSIYDNVYQELKKQNVPDDQAKAQAEAAQDYIGKNADNIFAGAGLGALAGGTGAERVLGNFVAKRLGTDLAKGAAKEQADGLIMRGVKEALKEAIPEGLQGGQEQFARNVALIREGFEAPEFEGVLGAAARDAAVGALTGAAVSPISGGKKEEAAPPAAPTPQQYTPQQLTSLRDKYSEAEGQLRDLSEAAKAPGLDPEARRAAINEFLQFKNNVFAPLRIEYMRNKRAIDQLGVVTLPPAVEAPPVEAPPVEAPPVAPPVAEAPPVAPPVAEPPVAPPPVAEAPPAEAPPVTPPTGQQPPTVDQPSPEPIRDTSSPSPVTEGPKSPEPAAAPVEPPVQVTPPERKDFQIDKPLEQIAQEVKGLTIPQLSRWAVENAPNTPAQAIATKAFDRINEYAKRGIFPGTVSVRNGANRNESGVRGAVSTTFYPSRPGAGFDATMRLTGLNRQGKADLYTGTNYATILHELLHAATHIQIHFNPNSQPVKELKALYAKVLDQVKKDIKAGKQHPALEKIKMGANTMRDVDELVSWGLTDHNFQNYLSTIPVGKKNAFSKFVELMRKLLDISPEYETALDSLMRTSENLLSAPVSEIEQQAGFQLKGLGIRRGKPAAPVKPPKAAAPVAPTPAAPAAPAAPERPGKPPVLDETGITPAKGRHPQVQAAAKALQQGKLSREEFEKYVDYYRPIAPVEADKLYPPSTVDQMRGALRGNEAKAKLNTPIQDGTRVGLRMDLPSREKGVPVVSIHEGKPNSDPKTGKPYKSAGKVIGYGSTGYIKDVFFAPRDQEKSLVMGIEPAKEPLQTAEGTWVNMTPAEVYRRVKDLMSDPAWTQVGFDPQRHGYFYDRKTREPVAKADEMFQVGQFLLAKNVQYAPKTEFLYEQPETVAAEERQVLPDLTQQLFVPQTTEERKQGYAIRLKNPVTLKDGTRLSGFTDPVKQTTFYGYDKNGERITVRRDAVNPEDIVFSKDSNRTAETLKRAMMAGREGRPETRTTEERTRRAPDTDAFRRWFGDSKVVDENGEPLVVYHGTNADFKAFKPTKIGEFGPAIYFASTPSEAGSYAGVPRRGQEDGAPNIIPVYLSLKNPYNKGVDAFWKEFGREGETDAQAIERAKAAGYDGVIEQKKDWRNKPFQHYVAFRSEQVKSAIGNRGTYGPLTEVITEEEIGPQETGRRALGTIEAMGMGVQPPGPSMLQRAKASIKEAGENPELTKQSIKKAASRFFDKFETYAFSSSSAFDNELRRQMMGDLKQNEDIIGALIDASTSQAVHADALASQFIIEGGLKYDPEAKKWVAYKEPDNFVELGKQLNEVAKKYGITEDEARRVAHTYFVAKRLRSLQERNEQDKKDVERLKAERAEATTKAEKEKITSQIDRLKDREAYIHLDDVQIDAGLDLGQMMPELDGVMDTWNGIRRNVRRVLVNSGLWTEEYADQMLDVIDYVPFYREAQLEEGKGPREFVRGLQVQAKEKQLKGSSQPVNDVIDNMVRWTQYAVNRSVRNDKAVRMVDAALDIPLLDGQPMAERVDEAKRGMNIVRIWRNGKQELYNMADPMFAEAFTGIQNIAIEEFKVLSRFANTLRDSVVLFPLFSFAQVPQDAYAAMFSSGLQPQYALRIPFLAVKEFIKTLRKSSATHNILKKYGAVGVRDFNSTVIRDDAEVFAGLKAPAGLTGKLKESLQHIAMAADNSVRQAVYEASVSQGLTKAEALEKAFEIINFRRRGTSRVFQVLGQTVPFFYAYLAASRVAYKTLTGVGISPQERSAALKTLAYTSAAVMTLSVLYSMMAAEDDDYKKTPAAVRDRTLTIPGTGGMRIPLRTDFFLLPKIVAEHTYLLMTDQGYQDSAKFRKSVRDALVDSVLSPTAVPQAIKPLLEVGINYDFFTKRPVIGTFEKQKELGRQFNESTSEFSKILGQTNLVSPIAADHLIRGMLGSVGGLFLWFTNQAVALSNPTVPRPASSMRELVEALPGTSGFISRTNESALKNDFYQLRDEVIKAVNTFNDIKKNSPEGIDDFIKNEKKMAQLIVGKQVQNINQQLARLRAQIRMISQMPATEMTAQQKQEAIKELRKVEEQILEAANVKEMRIRAQI